MTSNLQTGKIHHLVENRGIDKSKMLPSKCCKIKSAKNFTDNKLVNSIENLRQNIGDLTIGIAKNNRNEKYRNLVSLSLLKSIIDNTQQNLLLLNTNMASLVKEGKEANEQQNIFAENVMKNFQTITKNCLDQSSSFSLLVNRLSTMKASDNPPGEKIEPKNPSPEKSTQSTRRIGKPKNYGKLYLSGKPHNLDFSDEEGENQENQRNVEKSEKSRIENLPQPTRLFESSPQSKSGARIQEQSTRAFTQSPQSSRPIGKPMHYGTPGYYGKPLDHRRPSHHENPSHYGGRGHYNDPTYYGNSGRYTTSGYYETPSQYRIPTYYGESSYYWTPNLFETPLHCGTPSPSVYQPYYGGPSRRGKPPSFAEPGHSERSGSCENRYQRFNN